MSIRDTISPKGETKQPRRDAKRPQNDLGEMSKQTMTNNYNIQIRNYHKMITKRQGLQHKNKRKSKALKKKLCIDTIKIIQSYQKR